MSLADFHTDTGTLKKLDSDEFGETSVLSSFTVELDPVLGRRRIFSNDQEYVDGFETTLSPNSNIDTSHDRWELDYDGRSYQVESLLPVYEIGSNQLSHFEIELR